MNLRSPLEATVAVLVVLVGVLIGGMFAIFTRPSAQQTQTTSVATGGSSPATPARRTLVAPTPRPTAIATPVPTPMATPVATPVATAPAVQSPAAKPVTAAVAVAPRPGAWQIREANAQVGTIVWSGSGAAPSGGGDAIVLDVHKQSIAGRSAYPCERRTTLHVVLSGASAQTVPYQETNCSGATSSGEMRVTGFSGDGRSFSGSFWSAGSKLGDFTAQRS